MKKLLAAMTVSLFLASCTTTGSFDPAKLDDLVAKIQAYTAQACNLLPQAASVVALISAFYPPAAVAIDAVSVVGNAICNARPTQSLRKGATYSVRVVTAPNGKTVNVRVQPAR